MHIENTLVNTMYFRTENLAIYKSVYNEYILRTPETFSGWSNLEYFVEYLLDNGYQDAVTVIRNYEMLPGMGDYEYAPYDGNPMDPRYEDDEEDYEETPRQYFSTTTAFEVSPTSEYDPENTLKVKVHNRQDKPITIRQGDVILMLDKEQWYVLQDSLNSILQDNDFINDSNSDMPV